MGLALAEDVVTVLGMILITAFFVVGIAPVSSDRVFRFMMFIAAASLLILVIEYG